MSTVHDQGMNKHRSLGDAWHSLTCLHVAIPPFALPWRLKYSTYHTY